MNEQNVIPLGMPGIPKDAITILADGTIHVVIDTVAIQSEQSRLLGKYSDVVSVMPNGQVAVRIASVDDQQKALEFQRDFRKGIKEAEGLYKPTTSLMDLAKKTVLNWKNKLVDPWNAIDSAVSRADSNFRIEQQRQADARAKAAAAKALADEQERALNESLAMKEMGEEEAAEEHLAMTAEAPAPVVHVQAEVAKVAGITKRKTYSAELVNLAELVQYCAANPALIPMYLQANGPALNRTATTMKDEFAIPGMKLVTKYV